jgi:SAM-dependent methyltransferase
MKPPISYRKEIPFFYPKSEIEFRKDPYERYDSMVLRQSALHLADTLWGGYPMQAVFDFAQAHYPMAGITNILEIGCGVGRWIATLAQHYPGATCWGIDYSYQMLKRAHECWIQGKEVIIDLSDKGFPEPLRLPGYQLPNLQIGLAKAEELPFEANSQDMIVSAFLLDRLEDPLKGLLEFARVLKPEGIFLLISPLNFAQAVHWEALYPPIKIHALLGEIGFKLRSWNEALRIEEPLDARGNRISWQCLALAASKMC